MSWDASLTQHDPMAEEGDEGITVFSDGYTHNTSRMIYAALKEQGVDLPGVTWWEVLNGLSGRAGADWLGFILLGLRANPDGFREMNPENGWGNYDEMAKILTKMLSASRTFPHAHWWCGG